MSNFEDLPNEVIHKVLTYLKVEEIVMCHQVSKRIRGISHDESLWKKINLCSCKSVPAEFLQLVFNNGCKYLSLNQSTVVGNLHLEQSSQLRYLDMTDLTATDEVKEKSLDSWHSFEKISLIGMTLSKKMLFSIFYQNCKTLQVLNLSRCKGVSMGLIHYCVNLVELNLEKINQNISVDLLTESLSTKIEKLSLQHLKSIRDRHIKKLVTRCKKLRILYLRGTLISNESITTIVKELKPTLEELDVSCTHIQIAKLLDLGAMPNFRVLYCYNNVQPISMVESSLANVKINDILGKLRVADPEQTFKPKDGIWDVETKRIELPTFDDDGLSFDDDGPSFDIVIDLNHIF